MMEKKKKTQPQPDNNVARERRSDTLLKTQTHAAVRSCAGRRLAEAFHCSLVLRAEQLPAGSQGSEPLHVSGHSGRTRHAPTRSLNAALRLCSFGRRGRFWFAVRKFASPLCRHVALTQLRPYSVQSSSGPCARASRMRTAALTHQRTSGMRTGTVAGISE